MRVLPPPGSRRTLRRSVYADEYLRPWYEAVVGLVPDYDPFDAHTHIGANDPDGYRSRADELLEALDLIGAGAAVFPMHEPDGYPPANDYVLEQARASGGRLVAFCRLDPQGGAPRAEAGRRRDAGARGHYAPPPAGRVRPDGS